MSKQLDLFASAEKPEREVPESEWQSCRVCGKPVRPWGKLGTLEGCHASISLIDGKLRIIYYGSAHQDYGQRDWLKQLDHAVKRGWLIPVGNGEYQTADQYQ